MEPVLCTVEGRQVAPFAAEIGSALIRKAKPPCDRRANCSLTGAADPGRGGASDVAREVVMCRSLVVDDDPHSRAANS